MGVPFRFCAAALPAALLLVGQSGCTLPKRAQSALSPAGGESQPPSTPAAPPATSAAPAPAGTAERLVVDGQDGENCRFGLYAYLPATLAPHVIAVDFRFLKRASGESVGSGGIFVELPVPAGRVEQTPWARVWN